MKSLFFFELKQLSFNSITINYISDNKQTSFKRLILIIQKTKVLQLKSIYELYLLNSISQLLTVDKIQLLVFPKTYHMPLKQSYWKQLLS